MVIVFCISAILYFCNSIFLQFCLDHVCDPAKHLLLNYNSDDTWFCKTAFLFFCCFVFIFFYFNTT